MSDKFVDKSGLGHFLSNIKTAYANNASTTGFEVGKAGQADKLSTARAITFAGGDSTGTFSFDGSSNVSNIALNIGEGKVTLNKLETSVQTSLGKADTAVQSVTTGTTNGTILVDSTTVAVYGLQSAAYVPLIASTSISTTGTNALDARTAYDLSLRIDNIEGIGRFLSTWDCTTGLPEDDPAETTYTYKTGDYYIVNKVSEATPEVNYKPSGSTYTKRTPSTVLETSTEIVPGDFYFYTNSTSTDKWKLVHYERAEVTFKQIAGSPMSNTSLAAEFNKKVDKAAGYSLVVNTEITKLATVSTSANYVTSSTSNGYIKIDGTETKVYAHPTFTAAASDLYKVTIDGEGHVTATVKATYSDLPITKANLEGTIGNASTTTNGLMSSADKTKLDGVTEGATKVEASTVGHIKINGTDTTVADPYAGSAAGLVPTAITPATGTEAADYFLNMQSGWSVIPKVTNDEIDALFSTTI